MGSRRGPTECSRRCIVVSRVGAEVHVIPFAIASAQKSHRRGGGQLGGPPQSLAREGPAAGVVHQTDLIQMAGPSRELAIEGPHGKPQSAIRRGLARQSRDGRAGKSAPNGETLQATGSAHGIFRHRRVYADARHACLAHQLPRPPACLRARKVRTFFSERNCATPAVSHRWGSPH